VISIPAFSSLARRSLDNRVDPARSRRSDSPSKSVTLPVADDQGWWIGSSKIPQISSDCAGAFGLGPNCLDSSGAESQTRKFGFRLQRGKRGVTMGTPGTASGSTGNPCREQTSRSLTGRFPRQSSDVRNLCAAAQGERQRVGLESRQIRPLPCEETDEAPDALSDFRPETTLMGPRPARSRTFLHVGHTTEL